MKLELLAFLRQKDEAKIIERLHRSKRRSSDYYQLLKSLRMARIRKTVDEYVRLALISAVAAGVAGAVFGVLLSDVVAGVLGLFGVFLAIFFFTVLFSFLTYVLILGYPSFVASVRRSKIDAALPHAVAFMYALSLGGLSIVRIFEALGEHEGIYGEISKEARALVRNVNYFGSDITTALKNLAEITPSEKFKDFLEGLRSVIGSGGDLSEFLLMKTKQYQEEAVHDQKIFLNTLGLLSEVYVTGLVAGVLFMVIILVMLEMMTPGYLMLVHVVVYLVLPLGTVMFVTLLRTLAFKTEATVGKIPEEVAKDRLRGIPLRQDGGGYDAYIAEALRKYRLRRKLTVLKKPLKHLFEKPQHVFFVSAPAGIIYALLHLHASSASLIEFLDDQIVIALLIALVPFSVFYEMRRRWERKVEDAMPDFLRGIESTTEVGISLADSVKILSKQNIGVLTEEVKKMRRDLEWGALISEAFSKFERRLRLPAVSRIATLVRRASEATGDISSVMGVAADDAEMSKRLRKERFVDTLTYLVIIYIALGVFLFVLYILTKTFLPMIPTEEVSAGGLSFFASMDASKLRMLFMHAALIQALCSGFVAGELAEGDVQAGVKHAIVMISIAYVVFTMLL